LHPRRGAKLSISASRAAFFDAIEQSRPSVAAVEVYPPHEERLSVVSQLRERHPGLPIVVIVHSSSEAVAIAALRAGATEYLVAPVGETELLRAAAAFTRPAEHEERDACGIIGDHPSTRRVRSFLDRVATANSTVLITGETGTGKELAARHIHSHGLRSLRPFVSVNCAAVPDTLLESELFGHERGAFTGAHAASSGKFQQADGGTLFLDEIGDMSPLAQAKILRVLETREVWRLGGARGNPVNVRVVAATNRNIEQLVAEGSFRSDLYYRLNVARLQLPPLREHRSDIPILVRHYVGEMNRQFAKSITGLTPESLRELDNYKWPGNVRELKNFIEAAYIDLPDHHRGLASLPLSVLERLQTALDTPQERVQLLSALKAMRWNVSKAAQRLHISRMTLYRKISKHGITRDSCDIE